ncbi:type II secretion system protein GspK [Sphingomonas sp. HF-S3]|uniref:Type II secretion system protein GspK n=1 Tax=Sphingomonas rustica TaxID=3103142 RepID=A0ABV0BEW6_9SPHN
MTREVPQDEQGMILINVLMFVAIAAGMVLLLITREEVALDRGLRAREAARALAVARGGELSAIVGLRRDLEKSPEADYPAEPWGKLSESGAPIEGGTFDLAISDAEGRFNINSVRNGEAASLILFQTIAARVGVPDEQIDLLIQLVRLQGPVTDLRPLRLLEIEPAVRERLERILTALPGKTTVNLNSADQELLTILFNDPLVAQRLVQLRARKGFLDAADLVDQKATIPFGTSFRSNTFWVRTRVRIGGTTQQVATLMKRGFDQEGTAQVVPIERWRNAAVPPDAPPFVEKK